MATVTVEDPEKAKARQFGDCDRQWPHEDPDLDNRPKNRHPAESRYLEISIMEFHSLAKGFC